MAKLTEHGDQHLHQADGGADRDAPSGKLSLLAGLIEEIARTRHVDDIGAVVLPRLQEMLSASSAALGVDVGGTFRVVSRRGDASIASALESARAASGWSAAGAVHAIPGLPVLVVPLRMADRDVGALAFGFNAPRQSSEADTACLRTVATTMAIAIERGRLLADVSGRQERPRTPGGDQHTAFELLAQAGEVLSSSLDYDDTLAQVVRLSVPALADWCAIDVLSNAGDVRRIAVHHSDPAKIAFVHELQQRYPPDPNAKNGVANVLRTGVVEWVREIPESMLVEAAVDEEHKKLILDLGLRSYIAVPLRARDRVLGCLTLVQAESGRLYDEGDVVLAQDLARRAAQAVENALLYRDAEIMHGLGLTLAAELDQGKLVEAITEAATTLSGAQFGAFFYNVVRESGESYTLYKIAGVAPEHFTKFPMPRNTQVFAPTFAGKGIVRSDDIKQDPRYGHNRPYSGMPPGHLPVSSYLAVPVVSRTGRVIGGLFFGHEKTGVFTERAEKVVAGLAAQAAVAMDNAALFEKSERLIERLEKTNAELDQFAYVTSHDLKAPLRGIGNLAQWIEEDSGDALDEEGKKHLHLMKGRIHRMGALIDGILDFSRAGRVKSKPEEVDLGALMADVVEMLSPPPPAQILFEDLPAVFGERLLLQQVLMNLVSNGLKHAKRDDALVRVTCRDDADFVELSVADNGPGIAPTYHERIWGIFQTLESRDTVESTGIGLALVRKIVESRGGSAWVESAEGQGATFKFRWPKRTDLEKT